MPLAYRAPLRDLQFVNRALLGLEEEAVDLHASLAEAMAPFAEQVVLPLNATADREGCAWQAGEVRTPTGFVEAYRQWCALGWPGLCADAGHGGQALTALAFSQTQEIVAASCHAFQMLVSVNHCASLCLRAAASPALQSRWLPALASGAVLSTMAMTEPQAGSDLGLVRTRAEPAGDGRVRLHGAKVFISGGAHDLTDQVLHLVLARLPGAPAGTRGLTLFLVPRRLDDGRLNAVHCDGLEHKMGLHGNPTCALRFDGALGWQVGAPHQGLAALFPMMNQARLLSGLQGVGLSEAALQASLTYAHERRQGRNPAGRGPCPLVEHPDVQRLLLSQRAWTEGARALVHWTAHQIDRADAGDADAIALLALLTPVVKGFVCENAQRSIDLALQLHGGHGYVRETGVEQLARDARVLTLYEGTTGIQAIDLLVRKVLGADGDTLCTRLQAEIEGCLSGQPDTALRQALGATLDRWRDQTRHWRAAPGDALHGANAYLRLTGHLLLALMWTRMADASQDKSTVAHHYITELLPEAIRPLPAMATAPALATALALHSR